MAARARPVSGPIPALPPVTMKTLSGMAPMRPSSRIIWSAVGRASPGPPRFSFLWASVYLPGMVAVVE